MYLKHELYELIRSDERIFDFIQNSSLDGLWYWDLENPENEWMNARFWIVLGYNPDEMPHKSSAWKKIINQDDLNIANDNFTRHCENPDHPYDQIVRYRHKNGSTKWIRCRGLAIRDNAGKPIRMLGAHQDVSDYKNSEQALLSAIELAKENEKKFRNLINNSPIPTAITEKDGKLTYLNKQFIQTYGYTIQEIPSMDKWFEVVYHDVENRTFAINDWGRDVEKSIKNNIATGVKEYQVICKNGDIKKVAISAYFESEISIILFQDITERKQIEYELTESTERFKALHNASFGGIAIHDKGIILECNQGLSDMTGYSLDELIGMNGLLLIAPEHREMVMSQIVTGNEKPYEAIGLCKNGVRFPMRLEARNVPYKGKNVRTVEFRDITESKQSELLILEKSEKIAAQNAELKKTNLELNAAKEKAEESEKKQRILFESAGDAIFIHDTKSSQILAVNQRACEQLGYTLPELMSLPPDAVDSPEHCRLMPERIAKLMEQGHLTFETIHQRKDGSLVPTEVSAKRIIWDGEPVIMSICRDITERRKAEEVIIEREERFRSIFDNSLVGNSITYLDGRIETNIAFCEIVGYSSHELAKLKWQTITHPEDVSRDEEIVKAILSGDKFYDRWEKRYFRKNGDVVWVDISTTLHRNKQGKPLYFITSIIDITDQKQSESEIRNLNETLEKRIAERTRQLENSNKELTFHLSELEQFSFVSNHDLQEPLRGIVHFSELLKENYSGRLDEDGNLYIDFISKAASRMKELVKDLLEYSLLGKESTLSTIDCNTIVEEVLIDIDVSVKKSNARIVVQDLPTVIGYETELRLLFQNLIANAIKYQKTGNIPEINISAEIRNNEWLFKISDNGIGFDEKYRNKIFVLFQRLHNRNEYEGTGIGLAHCKKIVELHGGRIWVESIPGKGSTFSFTIPKA